MDNQDNLNTPNPDNAQAQPQAEPVSFSWKSQLSADLKNSPTLQKFDDTAEGLGKAFTSHLSLEKMLGNEKIPVPKGDDDAEGWARYNKAFGVPDKPDGYKLPDYAAPEGFKNPVDKAKFMEVAHKYRLTPQQAQGLHKDYTDMVYGEYNRLVGEYTAKMNDTKTALRKEWGDAYDSNVELGNFVINKFAGDEETANFIISQMIQDPRTIKFMADIGKQFSENKIGDFQYRQFSKSPEEAQKEIDSILKNPEHPYNSMKATQQEHEAAVDYVNRLYATVNKQG